MSHVYPDVSSVVPWVRFKKPYKVLTLYGGNPRLDTLVRQDKKKLISWEALLTYHPGTYE